MTTAAEQVKKAAEDATSAARTAVSETERTLTTVLRDGAYATVGAGDTLVRSARTFAERLTGVREEAPEQVKHFAEEFPDKVKHFAEEFPEKAKHLAEAAPDRAREFAKSYPADVDLSGLRASVGTEFDQLVARGRAVVEGVQHSRRTEEATKQAKTASSQVKAAATSLRTAAESTADQARTAVEGLREAAEERAKGTQSQVKAAQTSVSKAAEAAGEAATDAADMLGKDVPLEDRTVAELRKMAKAREVPGRTGMNKAELIRALS